jgi:hypothetical protein
MEAVKGKPEQHDKITDGPKGVAQTSLLKGFAGLGALKRGMMASDRRGSSRKTGRASR